MPATNIVLLTAGQVNDFRKSPFITKQKVVLSSEAAATILGVDEPGASDATQRAVIRGNGVKLTWNATELPLIASSNVPNAAGLVLADQLRTIVLVRALGGTWTPLIRVGSDTALTAGRFRVVAAAGNTLELQAAPTTDVMVLVIPAANQVTLTGGATVTDRRYEVDMPSFVATASAVVTVQRLMG
jgi:hypothetical protein